MRILQGGIGGTVVDTVGWEGATPREGPLDASYPSDPGTGGTISRCADRTDTDDNRVDFDAANPSPGSANLCIGLLINEVNYVAATGERFVELYNPQAYPADLSWVNIAYIPDGTGGAVQEHPTGTLPAGGYRTFMLPLEDAPSGVGVQPDFSFKKGYDYATWGGGGLTFGPFVEGSDFEVQDPDAGPSPTGMQGISRCGPDTNTTSFDFFGLPLTPGAANNCPTLLINEVDYSAPAGTPEFVEVVNTGPAAVDLFDWRFLLSNAAATTAPFVLASRGTTVAPGGRMTVCLGSGGPPTCPLVSAGQAIHDGPGGAAILSRWSRGSLDVVTWEGGGALVASEPGPPTTQLDDGGADESVARCPDSAPASGTLAGFRVSPPTLNTANTCGPAAGGLVINEVSHAESDDFVELYNPTAAAIDLAGWDLVIDPPRSVIELAGSVPAGGYLTVCFAETGCTQDVAGTSLPDEPSGVALRNPPDAVVDALSWGNGGVAPDTLAEGSDTTNLFDYGFGSNNSLSRCPDGQDTDANITDFSLQSNSPGAANPCTGPNAGGGFFLFPDQAPTSRSIWISYLRGISTWPDPAPPAPPPEVLLASDSVFADALASGSLQSTRPLLLNAPTALEDAVLERIQQLEVGTVRILGGEAAVSSGVADALAAAGLTVVRSAGPTRLETAEQIAQLAGSTVDTVLIARAFPAAGGDDTQAFADSLAAGAWAAATGWPILLSQTEVLSDTTRTYLDASAVTTAHVIGGEAALSTAVTDGLGALGIASQRHAGPTRFHTATAIAAGRGFGPSSPAGIRDPDRGAGGGILDGRLRRRRPGGGAGRADPPRQRRSAARGDADLPAAVGPAGPRPAAGDAVLHHHRGGLRRGGEDPGLLGQQDPRQERTGARSNSPGGCRRSPRRRFARAWPRCAWGWWYSPPCWSPCQRRPHPRPAATPTPTTGTRRTTGSRSTPACSCPADRSGGRAAPGADEHRAVHRARTAASTQPGQPRRASSTATRSCGPPAFQAGRWAVRAGRRPRLRRVRGLLRVLHAQRGDGREGVHRVGRRSSPGRRARSACGASPTTGRSRCSRSAAQPEGLAATVIQAPGLSAYTALWQNGVHYATGRYGTTGVYTRGGPRSAAELGHDRLARVRAGGRCRRRRRSPATRRAAPTRSPDERDPRPQRPVLGGPRGRTLGAKGSDVPTFWVHGFFDANTKPEHLDIWESLTGPKQAWFGQWDHIRGHEDGVGPPRYFLDEAFRFLDQHVRGIAPAVEEPGVTVQSGNGDGPLAQRGRMAAGRRAAVDPAAARPARTPTRPVTPATGSVPAAAQWTSRSPAARGAPGRRAGR